MIGLTAGEGGRFSALRARVLLSARGCRAACRCASTAPPAAPSPIRQPSRLPQRHILAPNDAIHFVFARYLRVRTMTCRYPTAAGRLPCGYCPDRRLRAARTRGQDWCGYRWSHRWPAMASLATFALDSQGRVTSWSVTATRLFGHLAAAVTGRDVCDILMTGPGQRQLVRPALPGVAAGRLWTATVAGGDLGEGRFAIRWEPLAGPDSGALVIAQRAWPQPSPSWLSEAAARIGSTLDLTQTASEVVDAAVPGFADGAAIYGTERLLAADEFTSPRPGHGVSVRRLAARLAGRPEAVTDRLLRPGEVLVYGPDAPHTRAMASGGPVLFDHLDGETVERIGRHPDGQEVTSGYTSFLAMPLIARGAVVGCATFGRAPASPAFAPGDIALAGELASRAAVCIDNARLYHRERRTALALQRGLLPGRPQGPAGLEVAHRYLPVGASVVGGDWHDIVPLTGGRAALIVGDAMGHGPEAAAVMVQLRTAAHTLADLELP